MEMEQKEWKIKSYWLKILFVISLVWGVINTLMFLYGFLIGIASI